MGARTRCPPEATRAVLVSPPMRALSVAGRLLLALGVLVLLFTAYQLWGTGIGEAHSQSELRARLDHELPTGAAATTHRVTAAAKANEKATAKARATAKAAPLQLAPSVPAPAPGQPIGEIRIPSIGLDQVVVEGVAETDLMKGPGHYPGTPLPGEAGNVGVAGHRTTYAHPFYDLNRVAPGDQVILTTPQGVFVYMAISQQVVAPTDVAVIAATTTPTLTLTTCNPRYSAATRLVLHAALIGTHLFSGGEDPATGGGGPRAGTVRHAAASSRGLAGTTGGGSVAGALGWGALLLAVAVATGLLARRAGSRLRRWAVYLPGTVACLVVLFFFFGAVSPLLPASL